MFLLIDNYDSFVHNLARYFENAGETCKIVRNDELTISEITALKPESIILSPGPKAPKDAGLCIEIVKQLGSTTPILGICLGHQAIGEAYGALTLRADKPVHGQSTSINHNNTGMFKNIPSPTSVGRYHSLIVQPKDKSDLIIDAKTEDGEIMAMHHRTHPVYGLQFHPESILTQCGEKLVENFIEIAQAWTLNRSKAA